MSSGDWSSLSSNLHINETTDEDGLLCRERTKNLSPLTFGLTSCATCYFYLFMDDPSKELWADEEWLVGPNNTRILADVHAAASTASVCSALTPDECDRWKSCCLAAEECCRRQVERLAAFRLRPPIAGGGGGGGGKPFCPQQWDGFGCWDFTAPGKVASDQCPEFINYAVPSEKSYKECTANGTWYRHPENDLEWTDYSNCISLANLKQSTFASIICNVISLSALIPSVVIFARYRPLRVQNRVLLHINLFSSFILYGIVTLLWDILIVLNRMEHVSNESNINQNGNGCKFLYVLTRYSRMANFLWMFCEAVFLHRILVKAFQPPKKLIVFYVTGWILPWIPVAIYVVLRFIYANTSCWIKPFGYWEWLIYVPNLLALFLNFVVLLDILRILVTQVQTHDNELSSYRRALKATFILVPLFGIQLFLVIYRPPYQSSFGYHYDMISAFVVNLQGLFVALIFCLVNGEVISHLKRSWQRLGAKVKRSDYQRTTSLSAVTTHSEMVSMAKDGHRNSANNSTTSASFSNGNGHRRPVTKDSKVSIVRYKRCGGGSTLDNDHVSCLATGALATDDVDNEHLVTRATFYLGTEEGEYGLKTSKIPLPSEQGTSTENDWRLG